MKFSIIIPTYNEEKIIADTIAQFSTLRKNGVVEVIVSDNVSTDNTIAIASASADKVVTISAEEKSTIGACRNRGAAVTTGDILWFIDADVRIPTLSALVNTLTQLFTEQPHCVAAIPCLRIYAEEEQFADKFWFGFTNVLMYIQNHLLHTGAAAGDCQIIRRAQFHALGGYNEKLVTSEDHDLFHRLSKKGTVRMLTHYSIEMSPRRIRRDGWYGVLKQWGKNWINDIVLKRPPREHTWKARR